MSEQSILLPPKPQPKPSPPRFLIDHNPCFILSALLMFLGCYLLNCALDPRAADIAKSLALLATINVYELALLALAFALFPKKSVPGRDGAILLFVQLLFLADGPFLIAQLFQVNSPWIPLIAIALTLLAILKSVLLLKAARIPLLPRTLGFLSINLLLIYLLPLLLAHLSVAGELPHNTLYVLWWIVGLLPALYEILARFQPLKIPLTSRQQFLRRAAVILPWLLLAFHLGFFHWIYRADFLAADLSPLLLGLTIASRRILPNRRLPKPQLAFARLITPLIALILTAISPPDIQLFTLPTDLTITPFILIAAALLITYGYLHSLTAAGSALAANLLVLLGRFCITDLIKALDWLLQTLRTFAHQLLLLLQTIIPSTITGWGILAIIAAFLLLALGSYFSLRPRTHEPPPA